MCSDSSDRVAVIVQIFGHPRRQGAACGRHGAVAPVPKYEIVDCSRIFILVPRKDDRALADWSLADGAITQPFDPVPAADTVAEQPRKRISGSR